MFKITKEIAGEISRLQQQYLDSYNNSKKSVSFTDFIAYERTPFYLRKGFQYDIENFAAVADYNKQLEDEKSIVGLTKQLGIYMCAKEKIESRGFFSKLFHPFRTMREKAKLKELKEDIISTFDVKEEAFDDIVSFVKDEFDGCSCIDTDGHIEVEKLITGNDEAEIEDYVSENKAEFKEIDEQSKTEEIKTEDKTEKDTEIFNDFENLKNAEEKLTKRKINFDKIEIGEDEIEIMGGENEFSAPEEVKDIKEMLKEEFAVKPQKKPEEKEKKAGTQLTAENKKTKARTNVKK